MAELAVPAGVGATGVRFRTYDGADDLPAMVAVTNAALAADGVTDVWTVEALRLEVEEATRADPRRDLLVATADDRLVGWARLEWADTTDGERLYWSVCHVHPAWRRRRIGTCLLALGEERRQEIAAVHAHPGTRTLMSWVDDGDEGGLALLGRSGYRRVRTYHHMVRETLDDVEVPPLPEGIEVRPVGREDLPRVWDALVEAFRDHFGGHDDSPEAYARWSGDPDLDLDLLVVAFDGREIVAGVQGSVNAQENAVNGYRRGWTDPVFTRRPWRRRGLAGALLARALIRLRERGMTSAQLDVDTENPNDALTIYARRGFRADRSSSEWRKPLHPSTRAGGGA